MTKNLIFIIPFICVSIFLQAQTNPVITAWLQNTTGTGTYYVQGNSTPIDNGILYNCQEVLYNNTYSFISTEGIPSYTTGPFLDGNPSVASAQGRTYRFPLNPVENTGTPTKTTAGNIGVFINGTSLYDYRDGVAWNTSTNSLCGGPGNPTCPGGPTADQAWNRDAIPAELDGFDCSKGHPAMGNYHHHQNPSAFDLDLNVLSTICSTYDADGLYAINPNVHSPLIGFAYDGFPIYGAYGYANTDGTGGITRIKSSYQLRNITTRTHHADGTDVDDGPNINATYFLGYFREDYEYVDHPNNEDYLDDHNGRFCVTPEYPNGTYAYFATVDENWNSTYPYVVGPTFYGVYANRVFTGTPMNTTVYLPDLCDYPTDIEVQLGSDPNKVIVSWASNVDAISYQLRYRRTLTTDWTTTSTTNLNKTVSGLTQNKLYDYRIRSLCSDGSWSDMTAIDKFRTVPCESPINITATQLNNNKVRVEWTDYNYADKYQIFFREVGEEDWSSMVTYYDGMNFRVLNGLIEGATYEYKVRSWCEVSYGPFSDIFQFTNNSSSSRLDQVSFPNKDNEEDYLDWDENLSLDHVQIFPNPASEFIAIQIQKLVRNPVNVQIFNAQMQLMGETQINAGSTICHFDTRTFYDGIYFVQLTDGEKDSTHKIIIKRN